ncbi:MAG: hypothetical protein JSV88_04715 [Candidatus Aminicenantes bacterium]|nr:MAG: hypothetical protein JSV88_04715 [Candidatus Aminicenantes bacterium]
MKQEKFGSQAKAGAAPKADENKGKPPDQYEIEVVNEFDEDEVDLHVVHVSRISSRIPSKTGKNSKPLEQGRQQHYLKPKEPQDPNNGKNKKRYVLAPLDYMIITLYKDDEREAKAKNWYVELPAQADFQFLPGDEGEKVLLTSLARKTRSKGKKVDETKHDEVKDGRTKIIMDRGQYEWKLEIWSPALEEYQSNMDPESLENDNGTPDNVKIGDNGP